MVQQGLNPLVVHMIVLYYAALTEVTLPFCIGFFVAATIVQAPWMKVAWHTLKLGATGLCPADASHCLCWQRARPRPPCETLSPAWCSCCRPRIFWA
ncbi:TRAP transporter large permease subunit [Aurantimonas aggregata]